MPSVVTRFRTALQVANGDGLFELLRIRRMLAMHLALTSMHLTLPMLTLMLLVATQWLFSEPMKWLKVWNSVLSPLWFGLF